MSDKRKDMDPDTGPDPDSDPAEHVPARGVQLELKRELHRRKLLGPMTMLMLMIIMIKMMIMMIAFVESETMHKLSLGPDC